MLALASLAGVAEAALRPVILVFQYPPGDAYTGVVLYHATSQANLDAGRDLTRIDLGLRPSDDNDVVRVGVRFDDRRNYYLALRTYDEDGNESANSNSGVVRAVAADDDDLLSESFESYRPGQDPDYWLDSASGSPGAGSSALFETIELEGAIAFGTTSSAADIHSHLVDPDSRDWASYEYSGRMRSNALVGSAGVTFLSAYPESAFYYRLARSGAGPFTLETRGGGELRCAGSTSTGVSATAGQWLQFRVRVTRFGSRNRLRASVWPDGASAPSGWQIDCWDRGTQAIGSGRVGVYSSNGGGNFWDQLRLVAVAPDGTPPGYVPETTPPPTPPPPTPPPPPPPPPTPAPAPSGYTSASRLVHWWRLGRDGNALGRDFANTAARVDAARSGRGVGARNIVSPNTANAFIELDGRVESLGNTYVTRYGAGDSWSLAVWVRPDEESDGDARYVFDLDASLTSRSDTKVALLLDVRNCWAVEVSDDRGRARSLPSPTPVARAQLGTRWYHVAAVKSGSRLTLYVDGQQVAQTDVGVPSQGDVARALAVGTRVIGGYGYNFPGAVHSIALWNSALRASEVSAVRSGGSWSLDLTR